MAIGFVAAFVFVILLAGSIYCFGYVSKATSAFNVLFLSTLLSLIIISCIILFTSNDHSFNSFFIGPTRSNWVWLSIAAFCGFIGSNYFSYLNLKTAGEKVNSLLAPTITAFVVLAGYFLLHERLLPMQFLGIGITIIAVFYYLFFSIEPGGFRITTVGALSGVACVLLRVAAIYAAISGIQQLPIYHASWIKLFIAFILLTPLIIYNYRKINFKMTTRFYVILTMGVVFENVLAGYLWYYSSLKLGVSLFQTIVATIPLIVFAIDVYLLKKYAHSLRFVAVSLVALVGIAITMIYSK
jgi:drug/metabolite transporter (DMT)-like permease